MSLYQEIAQEWPTFRAIAGVDLEIDGKPVEAIAVSDISEMLETTMEASTHTGSTRLAIRDFDWKSNGMGIEKEVHYRDRCWRVCGIASNPLSPIVFFDVAAEG